MSSRCVPVVSYGGRRPTPGTGRYTSRVVEFEEYAAQPDSELDLLTGALLVAMDAHPGLDFAAERARFDELAEPLAPEVLSRLEPTLQAAEVSAHLFSRHRFRGNEEDYYDPRNSFIDQVLDRHLGIPISLGVLYVEIARRAGVIAHGVSFPGHFLIAVGGEDQRILVDPFGSGDVLDQDALERLWRQATAASTPLPTSVLNPASVRQIVGRMLLNLRGIYASRGEYSNLLLVLDRIVTLVPDSLSEVRDRGLLQAQMGAPRAAVADLERYMMLAPDADDVPEMKGIVHRLLRADAVLH